MFPPIHDLIPIDGGQDPDEMNQQRAEWGRLACEAISKATGCDLFDEAPGDAIANILHFVTQQASSTPESVLQTAVMHFNEETGA
jgi:hypothetical protein